MPASDVLLAVSDTFKIHILYQQTNIQRVRGKETETERGRQWNRIKVSPHIIYDYRLARPFRSLTLPCRRERARVPLPKPRQARLLRVIACWPVDVNWCIVHQHTYTYKCILVVCVWVCGCAVRTIPNVCTNCRISEAAASLNRTAQHHIQTRGTDTKQKRKSHKMSLSSLSLKLPFNYTHWNPNATTHSSDGFYLRTQFYPDDFPQNHPSPLNARQTDNRRRVLWFAQTNRRGESLCTHALELHYMPYAIQYTQTEHTIHTHAHIENFSH